MALDLLDKLIQDLCVVTESLIEIEDDFDIAAWNPFPKKETSTHPVKPSKTSHKKGKKQDHHEIKDGVYRSVC